MSDDLALRHMNAFRCLGGECEDTCCRSWTIPVDEEHYRVLERALPPAELSRTFAVLDEKSRAQRRFALVVLDERGRCPLLDAEALCTLHRRDESLLPDACATYPRVVARVGGHRELYGALSCPEVVRGALLGEGVDRVEAIDAAFGRGAVEQELLGGPDSAQRFDLLRGAMHALVAGEEQALDSRLFALAHLAHQLAPVVAARPAPEVLAAAVAPLTEPELVAELHRRFQGAPSEAPGALGLVARLVGSRFDGAGARLGQLAAEVLASFGEVRSPEALWSDYARRREAVAPELCARLEQALRRYARHFVWKEWYSFSPGLWPYAQGLLVRLAALRLLVLAPPDPPAGMAELERRLVVAVYAFTRAIEHNARFRQALGELTVRALPTLAHSAELLRM